MVQILSCVHSKLFSHQYKQEEEEEGKKKKKVSNKDVRKKPDLIIT
jgi:hypothetical protein